MNRLLLLLLGALLPSFHPAHGADGTPAAKAKPKVLFIAIVHIYPTRCDLTGLPTPKHVQGPSIRSLLAQPDAAWDKPAVMTWLYQNHAVRSEDWRYIRYANGDEELYHNSVDPLEWTNLVKMPEYTEQKAAMARWLPNVNIETPGGKMKYPNTVPSPPGRGSG